MAVPSRDEELGPEELGPEDSSVRPLLGRTQADVAATLAHEIRNPLATARIYAELLRGCRPDEKDELLASLRKALAQLDAVVTFILRMSQGQVAATSSVELAQVARDAVTLTSSPHSISVSGEAVRARAHETLVLHVMVNLLNNALDAVATIEHPAVAVRVFRDGNHAVIMVDDNGPGVAAELSALIFDPFFTTKRGGTGVGLAISKKTVESIGGTLALVSRAGGARFEVRLPLW